MSKYYGVVCWDSPKGQDHTRLWESPLCDNTQQAWESAMAELRSDKYPAIGTFIVVAAQGGEQ
jgi:hypothetical protein